MKTRKLRLHRETLLNLDAGELQRVAGADTAACPTAQILCTTRTLNTNDPTCKSFCVICRTAILC